VAGTNGVVKAGAGTLVLSGNLTYSGATIINDGTLQLTSGPLFNQRNPNTTYTINAGSVMLAGNGGDSCLWDTRVTNNGGILQIACASGNDALRLLTMNGGTVTMAAGYETNVVRMYQGDLWTLDGVNTITPIFRMFNFGGGQVTLNVTGGTTTLSGTLNDWPGLAGAQVIKTGAGTLDLTGTNTYTGGTVINNGTLVVNGSLAAGSAVTVGSAGTLGGTGTIGGAVNVQAGGTLSPGASIGTLNLGSSLSLSGNVLIEVNKALAPSNDVVSVTGTLAYGGTLTATNIGGTALVAGDSFPVFPAGGSGDFAAIAGSPGAGLIWSFNPASGVLSVVSVSQITYSVSGGQLTLSWPADYTGWTLQSQTNSLASGLTGTWYPVAGSTGTNQMTFPVDPANPTVFYRLSLP
jgi:fibronectin-binding autotransporter adhesin